jgi:hypothetical protein
MRITPLSVNLFLLLKSMSVFSNARTTSFLQPADEATVQAKIPFARILYGSHRNVKNRNGTVTGSGWPERFIEK